MLETTREVVGPITAEPNAKNTQLSDSLKKAMAPGQFLQKKRDEFGRCLSLNQLSWLSSVKETFIAEVTHIAKENPCAALAILKKALNPASDEYGVLCRDNKSGYQKPGYNPTTTIKKLRELEGALIQRALQLDIQEAEKSLKLVELAKKLGLPAVNEMSQIDQAVVENAFAQLAEATSSEQQNTSLSTYLKECMAPGKFVDQSKNQFGRYLSQSHLNLLSWVKEKFSTEVTHIAKENPRAALAILKKALNPASDEYGVLCRDNDSGYKKLGYDPTTTIKNLRELEGALIKIVLQLDIQEAEKSRKLVELAKKSEPRAVNEMSQIDQAVVENAFAQLAEATSSEQQNTSLSNYLEKLMVPKMFGQQPENEFGRCLSLDQLGLLSWVKKRFIAEVTHIAKENPRAALAILKKALNPDSDEYGVLCRDNKSGYPKPGYNPTTTIRTLREIQEKLIPVVKELSRKEENKSLRLQRLLANLKTSQVEYVDAKEEEIDVTPQYLFKYARELLSKNPSAALELLNQYFSQEDSPTLSPDLVRNTTLLTAEMNVLKVTSKIVVDLLVNQAADLAKRDSAAALALLDSCLPQAGSAGFASDKQQLRDMYALKAKVIAGLLFAHAQSLQETESAGAALGLLDECLASGSVEDSTLLEQMRILKVELSTKGVVAAAQPQPVAAVVANEEKGDDVSQVMISENSVEAVQTAVAAAEMNIPDKLRCLLSSAETILEIPDADETQQPLLIGFRDSIFLEIKKLAKENKQTALRLLETLEDENSVLGKLIRKAQRYFSKPSPESGTWKEMRDLAKTLRDPIVAAKTLVLQSVNQSSWWEGSPKGRGLDPNKACINATGKGGEESEGLTIIGNFDL